MMSSEASGMDEPKYLIGHDLAHQINADGSVLREIAIDSNMSDGEVRAKLSHLTGVPGEDIKIRDIEPRQGKNSRTFGFSNWSASKWEPEGPKPNWVTPDNPELN